jgi:hypothetical protein
LSKDRGIGGKIDFAGDEGEFVFGAVIEFAGEGGFGKKGAGGEITLLESKKGIRSATALKKGF